MHCDPGSNARDHQQTKVNGIARVQGHQLKFEWPMIIALQHRLGLCIGTNCLMAIATAFKHCFRPLTAGVVHPPTDTLWPVAWISWLPTLLCVEFFLSRKPTTLAMRHLAPA